MSGLAGLAGSQAPSIGSIVHLELHTGDGLTACGFLAGLLGWRSEPVRAGAGSYLALGVGDRIGGGIVECGSTPAQWLPYVLVDRVDHATEQASGLGASVLVDPREGPAGWRSVVTSPATGMIAFWQPKGGRHR